MKLKVYDMTNTAPKPKEKCLIRIVRSNGTFSMSAGVVKALELKDGDGMIVVQDETSEKDFYLMKSTTPESFKLRDKVGNNMLFNSSKLAGIVLDAVKIKMSSSFKVVTEPTNCSIDGVTVDLYPIITNNPIKAK